jgi:hypothetical protein
MGVTPGVADPLLKVALPGNLDEGDGAPEEDNCKLGLMCSENGNEKLFADWSRLLSKSCAVPNVYQSVLVSFATELGTQKPLKLIKSSIILSAPESPEKAKRVQNSSKTGPLGAAP